MGYFSKVDTLAGNWFAWGRWCATAFALLSPPLAITFTVFILTLSIFFFFFPTFALLSPILLQGLGLGVSKQADGECLSYWL